MFLPSYSLANIVIWFKIIRKKLGGFALNTFLYKFQNVFVTPVSQRVSKAKDDMACSLFELFTIIRAALLCNFSKELALTLPQHVHISIAVLENW